MSILFDALSKAAQDYKEHSNQIEFSPHPFTSLSERSSRAWKVLVSISLIAAGCVIGAVAMFVFTPTDPKFATELVQAMPQPTITAANKATKEKNTGIAIKEEELTATREDFDETVEAVKSAPVVEEKPRVESTQPLIEVTTPQVEPVYMRHARALTALQNRDLATALYLYDELLQQNPSDSEALKGKIVAHQTRANSDDIQALDHLVKTRAENPVLYAALADVLSRNNRNAEAAVAWQNALNLDSSNERYKLGLAISYDRAGEFEKALKIYNTVQEPIPADVRERIKYLTSTFGVEISNETPQEPVFSVTE